MCCPSVLHAATVTLRSVSLESLDSTIFSFVPLAMSVSQMPSLFEMSSASPAGL